MRRKHGLRRLGIFSAVAGIVMLAWYGIPYLQSVEIGFSTDSEFTVETQPAQTEHFDIIPWADGIGDTELQFSEESVTPSKVISWESDGSKAMWNANPYPKMGETKSGEIIAKQFGKQSGSLFFSLAKGGQVRNSTSIPNSELKTESEQLPALPLKLDGTPMVLLYHTHTTESYVETERGTYSAEFSFRTTEPDKNMVMVGDAIAAELEKAGIGVIHAQEIHDYPVWSGSYSRSEKTVQAILEAYPSICIALDIHRDAISQQNDIIAPVVTVNGKQSAQIMIISGCDDGTMGMPNFRQNFHLACQLQQTAETLYPGFTRPILFDYRKYNQHLTTGSLLIEVGSQGNTMEEARYAGELFGKSLVETIRNLANTTQS